MGLILSTVQSVLDRESADYDVDKGDYFVYVTYLLKSECGPIEEKIVLSEEDEWFCVFGFFPTPISLDCLEKVYPVLSRINTEEIFTTICVDEEDGELYVRCSCAVDGNVVNAEIVNTARYAVLRTINNVHDRVLKAVQDD